jgi:hypothetical protein
LLLQSEFVSFLENIYSVFLVLDFWKLPEL